MSIIEPSDLISEFLLAEKKVSEKFGTLSIEEFNWKPSADRWSVAECLEHLNLTGSKLVPYMEKSIEKGNRKRIFGDPPFKLGAFDRWFSNGTGPDGWKITAPKLYRPASSDLNKEIVIREFSDLQQDFIRILENDNGVDLSRIKARSPITPLLRLSVAGWLKSMATHQQRHIKQAERVTQADGFGSMN